MAVAPDLDAVFHALADPTRRAIVRQLAQGDASISAVAEPFEMTLPAVSKHVRVLESAGLVQRRKQGRSHVLRLSPDPMSDAVGWMEHTRAFWEGALDRLEALVSEELARDA